MNKSISALFFLSWLCLLCFPACTSIGIDEATLFLKTQTPVSRPSFSGPNIAAGRPYTLYPPPNYPYCTDPGDSTQLTDGKYARGLFWTQTATVGWNPKEPVVITIDLGDAYPISGVTYHTAAGTAGVEWPLSIFVLVSDDGDTFYEAGELVSSGDQAGIPPVDTYANHFFQTHDLRVSGRYVALAISGSPYIFTDEIEIYRGDTAEATHPARTQPIIDIGHFVRSKDLAQSVERRLRYDEHLMRQEIEATPLNDTDKADLHRALDVLTTRTDHDPVEASSFKAILPLNTTHRALFRLQARIWRSLNRPPILVWQQGMWDWLSHIGLPPEDAQPEVKVRMMQNEYRSAAFLISNTTDTEVVCRISLHGLPEGMNPAYVHLYKVPWTDTRQGTPVADALVEAEYMEDAFLIPVPSGMTHRVWLTCHPDTVPPGVYRGHILVSSPTTQTEVPMTLDIAPVRFPDQPALHLGGWDYTSPEPKYDVTPDNSKVVIDLLSQHFVDTPWATGTVLPYGRYADSGDLSTEPDTTLFIKWITDWPDARQYAVFLNVNDHLDSTPVEAPLFEKKVRSWIAFWALFLSKHQIDPSRLLLHLVDEPESKERDALAAAWAHAIQQASTGVRVFENPTHRQPADIDPRLIQSSDLLCFNRLHVVRTPNAFKSLFNRLITSKKELAFYSATGPTRTLDPYLYYRLQAWTCYQYGAQGMYFWAFGDDGGGSSWNEYQHRNVAYIPFFLDKTSAVSSLHLEAIRQGVEDYEYLVMLKKCLAESQGHPAYRQVRRQAEFLLGKAVGQITENAAGKNWAWQQTSVDRNQADVIRLEILDVLQKLNATASSP